MIRHRAFLGISLLCALLSSAAPAQEDSKALQNRLNTLLDNKVLTLRGLYRSDSLHLAADGSLAAPAEVGMGPSDAQIAVANIELQPARLVLTGTLPLMYYSLKTGTAMYAAGTVRRSVQIDLASSPTAATLEDAIWKAFYRPEERIATPCTDEEAAMFRQNLSTKIAESGRSKDKKKKKASADGAGTPRPVTPQCLPNGERGVFRVNGDSFKAPKPIKTEDPKYTDEATRKRVEGTVVMAVVIDEQGRTSTIMVTQTLDAGLDAKAAEAVHNWRFAPATHDGVPVPVQIIVETEFHLMR